VWLVVLTLHWPIFPNMLVPGDEIRSPSVGKPGRVEQVILSGSELTAMPIEDKLQPMVVRIVGVFPHGDSFRYDIQFQGLVPGQYDLAKYLRRKDGTDANNLPAIPVTVQSLLPPGQIEPHPLQYTWWPHLGGYRTMSTAFLVAWIGVLAALALIGRKRNRREAHRPQQQTFADLLRERLALASRNELRREQYAELERMLVVLWRRKLGLDEVALAEAIRQIRDHTEAGPLMRQLEQWMHSPNRAQDIDLGKLVEPYRSIAANEWEIPA
jgi:hypothetical protein